MLIKAKFASKCGKCGGVIQAGDKIVWEHGSPPDHETCPAVTADEIDRIIARLANHCETVLVHRALREPDRADELFRRRKGLLSVIKFLYAEENEIRSGR